MLTKDEIDDFDLPKSLDELDDDMMLTDNDSFNEDDFLQTISNLDIPILQENDSILLRDASANEIMFEATNHDLSALTPPRDIQSPTYSIISNSLDNYHITDSSQQQSLDYLTSEFIPNQEIKLEDIKVENMITDYDQCSTNNFSNFLFPSQIHSLSSTDIVPEIKSNSPNKYVLDTPPISPPEINEYNSDSNIILNEQIQFDNYPQTQIVLGSSKYRLVQVNCDDETKNNMINVKNENVIRKKSMPVKTDIEQLKINTKFQNLNNKSQKVISVDNLNIPHIKSTQPAIVSVQNLILNDDVPLVQCYSKQCTTENNNVQIISIPNASCNAAVVVKSINGIKTNKLNSVSEVDLKAIKRHQRMIKNRESACMSRKRKRDYVTALEVQIKQLSVENQKLKTENETLRKKLSESGSGLKQILYCMPTNGHKNSALLLAMLLMVSLNIGSIGFFYKRENNDVLKYSRIEQMNEDHKHLRSLLWMPDTWTNSTDFDGQSNVSNFDSSNASNTKFSLCSMLINQTESIRLASQLHKWIGEPLFNLTNSNQLKYLNKKRKVSIKNTVKSLGEFTGSNRYFSLKKSYRQRRYHKNSKRNEVQVYSFDPKYYEYAQFFESIDKRDDTFYVVSFSGDHMLLPALNHNKTLRPKMSLILPALTINDSKSAGNDYITFMKIDCDVTDTNLVHVKGDLIPQHIRNTISNSTDCKSENKTQKKSNIKTPKKINNATSDNITLPENRNSKIYKPYFIKDNLNVKRVGRKLIYP